MHLHIRRPLEGSGITKIQLFETEGILLNPLTPEFLHLRQLLAYTCL